VEFGADMKSKGQTSVEFLFLFLIMLMYIQTVVHPAVDDSSASIIAINRTGQAKLAAMKLSNAVNEVSALSGESSKTLWLFFDEDTNFWCDQANNEIKFEVGSDANVDNLANCQDNKCWGGVELLNGISLNCSNFPSAGNPRAPPKMQARVWKDGSGDTFIQRIL